jgi:polyisoprenyl-teichoic acid--peptidoglycan teichoic acid transferase
MDNRNPKHNLGRGRNVDGFIVNRRGRTIDSSFRKFPDTHNLQRTNRIVTENMRNAQSSNISNALSNQPRAGMAQPNRFRDPSEVELTRQPDRKSRRHHQPDKQSHWGRNLAKTGLTLLILLVCVGGWLGFKFIHSIDKVFGGNLFSDVNSLFSTTRLKGEQQGRVNILLAGDSSDQPGHGGQDLTDSILLLSIDTRNHTAFLLSIPRDLWVQVPTLGDQKINAANDVSSFSQPGYPSGGMGQLQEIVQTDLGIPIDYYALSDYGAFRDAVDAVGGVKVNIQSPDPRGLYDPNTNLDLPNGWVSLNGQEALNLARARGDGYGSYGFPDSDFDRTEHQRQLFTAIVSKAQTLGFLDDPVKISDLFNAFGNNVQTDLNLSDIFRLAQITKGINLTNIKSHAYCSTLTTNICSSPILTTYTDPDSQEEALIPTAGLFDYTQLQQYYQQLTN